MFSNRSRPTLCCLLRLLTSFLSSRFQSRRTIYFRIKRERWMFELSLNTTKIKFFCESVDVDVTLCSFLTHSTRHPRSSFVDDNFLWEHLQLAQSSQVGSVGPKYRTRPTKWCSNVNRKKRPVIVPDWEHVNDNYMVMIYTVGRNQAWMLGAHHRHVPAPLSNRLKYRILAGMTSRTSEKWTLKYR